MLNLLLARTEPWMEWLWTTTWQSSVLIGIILLAQRTLGRWLAPRWRHALWLLVMARLAWPCSPESRWSIFNLTRFTRESHGAAPMMAGSRENAQRAPGPGPGLASGLQTGAVAPQEKVPSTIRRPGTAAATIPGPKVGELALVLGLPGIWLAGTMVFAVHVWLGLRRLRHGLRERVTVVDPSVLGVLAECQKRMGVRGRVALQETGAVKSPALCGLWRARLLLPKGFIERFPPAELRFVFLHELAHLRRGDIALNWAATVLQIAHWFNPLVWLAFRRMRADRELACDALVLSVTREEESQPYGETIIKLMEAFSQSPARPALVGIMEDKNQMKRRIHMIATYKKPGPWSLCAGLLLPLIGALTLTQARTEKTVEPVTPPHAWNDTATGVSPTNIMTVTIRKNQIYLATKAITVEDLRAELEKQAGNAPGLILVIRSEGDAPFGKIATLLDMAKGVAIKGVTLQTAETGTELGDTLAPGVRDMAPVKETDANSTDQTGLIRRLKELDRQKTFGALELSAARESLSQLQARYNEDQPFVKQRRAEVQALESRGKALAAEEQQISTRVRDFVLHPQPGEVVKHPAPPFTRHFVRLVADLGALTFEGESTTWQDLPELLGQVPNRPQTLLELAAATDDMTLRQLKEAETKCRMLAAQYRFESLSLVGVQPARSKGSPSQDVTSTGSPATSGATETDRPPRVFYVTGEVLNRARLVMLGETQYTVFDAIRQAGGLTKAANDRRIQLIRQGKTQYLDLQALKNIKDTNQMIYLEPDDIIHVPQAVW